MYTVKWNLNKKNAQIKIQTYKKGTAELKRCETVKGTSLMVFFVWFVIMICSKSEFHKKKKTFRVKRLFWKALTNSSLRLWRKLDPVTRLSGSDWLRWECLININKNGMFYRKTEQNTKLDQKLTLELEKKEVEFLTGIIW